MSKGKKWLIAGIALTALYLILSIVFSVTAYVFTMNFEEYATDWHKKQYVAFSRKSYKEEAPVFMSLEEFESKFNEREYAFSEYNTRTYFESLTSEKDKLLYNIYEYAQENNYPYIYIETIIPETSESLKLTLFLLSMDSPVIDQNSQVNYYALEFFDVTGNYRFLPLTKSFETYCLYIQEFETTEAEKINESVEKAEEILKELNLDKYKTETEKAKAIYTYLGKNIEYKEYTSYLDSSFLYDALCEGKSNCDGYANAFSLLCNMSGIDCTEKMTSSKFEDIDSGHTWNTAKLDGIWYNIDATYSPKYTSGNLKGIPFRFGYSDQYQFDNNIYPTFVPRCNDDITPPHYTFKDNKSDDVADIISDLLTEEEGKYLTFVFEAYDKDKEKDIMNKVNQTTYLGFTYTTLEADNLTYLFLTNFK